MDYEKKYKQLYTLISDLYPFMSEYCKEKIEGFFPELAESEDEKIKEELITLIQGYEKGCYVAISPSKIKKFTIWLKKQGEKLPAGFYYVNSEGEKFYSDTFKYGDVTLHVEKQGEKPVIEMKSPEESLGISTKEYNDIVNDCLYGESKSTDNTEPKFKVGDKVYNINDRLECTIESIDDAVYCCDTTNFDIKDQNNWELVEQKPVAWSEEDEKMVDNILTPLAARYPFDIYQPMYNWLKALKDRVQPKQKWSGEDERMCQETIDWFEKKCFPYALEHENPARESIKWLKSLKQRIGG